ncbi:MAG: hypothetical protein EU548_10125 [Promethearchaeota archaeon]|nr:MAG: hypothetical protein EU548_10125 [Candidatus Lokiarchaeota archaeon]
MSVRESLIKHLTAILRESESTLLVVLCDLNGLSIAKIGRKSEINISPNQITSLASAAFSVSQENWNDLDIQEQVVSFTFFEKVCLITVKINQTLLTIVHDYFNEWPLDPDSLASSIYYLKQELNRFFGSEKEPEEELEKFSNKVRNALYLIEMGTEIDNLSYAPDEYDPLNPLPAISTILDSLQNEIFIRYSLANASGLMLDAREVSGQNLPISIEAFSANSTVAFQKMKEESQQSSIGELLSYIAISGETHEQLYGLITCPSGKVSFSKSNEISNIEEAYFIGLFSLDYGGIPIIGEIRNIIYSILEITGNDNITENFIEAAEILTSSKFD